MENKKAIYVSLLAAVIAGLSYFYYVNLKVEREIGDLKDVVVIVKAKVNIPSGTRIDESMVEQYTFPKRYLPPKVVENPNQVIGQVALATIFKDEPILLSKLVPFDESSLDRRIPEGYRALTIGVSDRQEVPGVAGMIRPGHFVDVMVTVHVNTMEIEKGRASNVPFIPTSAQALKAEVRTFLQNVKVLSVGRDFSLQTANVNRSGGGQSQRQYSTKNVTVALKPDEVQKMVLAQSIGRITLVLRRFNDTEVTPLDYVDPFRAFGIKLPVVQGPAPAYKEIRGGQVVATPF